MIAYFTDDPGVAGSKYTVSGYDGAVLGSYDDADTVIELIKRKPNRECTVRFGAGLSWIGPEADELARRIVEL